jgi:HicB family
MRRSNFALRLQPSLLEEARKAAESEGVALNQLINVAVAEKVSSLRTQEYFRDRASRSDRREALRILNRAGKGNRPVAGDELPDQEQIMEKKPSRKAAQGNVATAKRLKKKTHGA